MKKFTPRPYQSVIADFIAATPRCGVWAGMGLGKTSATLMALDMLSLVEDVFPVLVLAPLRVANSTWPDEVEKWQEFSHLKVVSITGSKANRLQALHSKADIYTVNYENIPWLMGNFPKEIPYKVIVADESTKLKGFRTRQGTQRARALALKLKGRPDIRVIELTGTPSPNGLKDLWGQAWFLDRGNRLGISYSAFEQRWFRKSYNGFDVIPLPHAEAEIHEKLQDICISLNPEDYFNLKEPIVNKIYVDLPKRARKLYDDMETQMFMELEDGDVEAFNAASRTNKCLQLANGAAYLGEKAETWEEVHDEKLQALEQVIEEAAGMPVLVAYNFRSDLDRLKRRFPKGHVLDSKPGVLRDWNTGKIPILFAHPASAGHGLNLQDGGNILVFFGHNWNLEEFLQISERIGPVRQLQAGYNRPVYIHHIIARNTVDELVMARRETKKEVQDLLMEAMKHREDL